MEPKEPLKEEEILEQYKMRQKESDSVKAWSKEYATEDILNIYLEKSGYPASRPKAQRSIVPIREAIEEQGILEQYKMRQKESDSVRAWSKEYGAEDILNMYLEKSGYPTCRAA